MALTTKTRIFLPMFAVLALAACQMSQAVPPLSGSTGEADETGAGDVNFPDDTHADASTGADATLPGSTTSGGGVTGVGADESTTGDGPGGGESESSSSDGAVVETCVERNDMGVAECDQYVSWFSSCIDAGLQDGPAQAARDALEDSCNAWELDAATADGQESIADACRIASHDVRSDCGWMCFDIGIGVPECDEYFQEGLVCIESIENDKVAELTTDAMRQRCESWWNETQNPESTADVEGACTTKLADILNGCEW